MKNHQILLSALERIADPLNTHFKGDAQVVAREAIQKWNESADAECEQASNGKHMWAMFGDQGRPRCNWCNEVSLKSWAELRAAPLSELTDKEPPEGEGVEDKAAQSSQSSLSAYRTVMADSVVRKETDHGPSVYFVRDNHTPLRLPLDVDDAIREVVEELNEGNTHGTVISKTIEGFPQIHCRGNNFREVFLNNIRAAYARFPELNPKKWVMVDAPKLKALKEQPATLEELQAFVVGLTNQYNRLAIDFVKTQREPTKDRYGL